MIDGDGYLQITDRKKDIIVNSGGDNVAPQRVEGFLALQPEIGQAMVYGDRRPYLVALIVPDTDFAAEWARRRGRSPQSLADDPNRSEEHTSELQSLMRNSYAVFCLKKKNTTPYTTKHTHYN